VPRRSANELTPPAEQVARFRCDLEAITGAVPDADHRLGLAVSGGSDSLALLLLAAAAYPGLVVAATVDHRLRPEAADEAAFVHRFCGQLGVPHDILNRPDETPPRGNLQEWARWLRYILLQFWGTGTLGSDRPWRVEWVAVAHQQNDVAETLLMRARRGAGLRGLAAMRRSRPLCEGIPGPALVRPLLDWSRAELAGIVAEAGLRAVDDSSNSDPRYDRARMRALLATSEELPAQRLALAAFNLRHAEEALVWAAEREWQARSRTEAGLVWLAATDLPYELQRRLVARAVQCVSPEGPFPLRGDGLDRLIATLVSGKTGTIAGVKASARHGEWHFSPAPARRSH
jgi:tRNA(Ile)-lysidine synthase